MSGVSGKPAFGFLGWDFGDFAQFRRSGALLDPRILQFPISVISAYQW
jgi:hypothetical protein